MPGQRVDASTGAAVPAPDKALDGGLVPTRSPAIAMVALIAVGGLLGACSAAPAASPGSSSSPTPAVQTPAVSPSPSPEGSPSRGATLVMRVTTEGGFIGPAAHLAQLPVAVVYADGRILTPAPVEAIYPGPLLPVESVRTVDPAGLAAIRAAIAAAGLDAGGGTNPGIGADAADTVFVAQVGDRLVTTRFPALGIGGHGPGQAGGGPGGSADPQREAALALLTRLTDPTDMWGGPAAAGTAYVPTAYRVFVAPGAPIASDPATARRPVAWPLSAPLASFGRAAVPDRGIAGLRVGVVSGADAATLGPVLEAATQVTPFASGGAQFTLYVTPLFPDEAAG